MMNRNKPRLESIPEECCVCFEILDSRNHTELMFECNHTSFHTYCAVKCCSCPLCRAPFILINDGEIENVKLILVFINFVMIIYPVIIAFLLIFGII